MKTNTLLLSGILLSLVAIPGRGQTFVGTNDPGSGTAFTFDVSPGATNLSLTVSNSSTAFSHLYLKVGTGAGVATYDFVARLDRAGNALNLETPELIPGTNYSLWVQTPTNSVRHSFAVGFSANRADARSVTMPVTKTLSLGVTGALSAGETNYFQIDVATNLVGWRLVLTSSGTTDPDLSIQRGALPTPASYLRSSVNRSIDTLFLDNLAATSATYFVAVTIPKTELGNATYTLRAELAPLVTLAWEPGVTPSALTAYTNLSTLGGDYFFKITTLPTDSGVWRTRLDVQSGEVDLYLRKTSLPTPTSFDFAATRPGSDGVALVEGGQYQAGAVWYAMVTALPDARWSIYSGNLYVTPIPAPAQNESGVRHTAIEPEGMNFYRSTINSNTPAWHLGLDGLTNTICLRKGDTAHPYSSAYYDWKHPGQILLVPPYLKSDTEYFVTVTGTPGQAFTLDSRQQPVVEMAFDAGAEVAATNYGYLTFHVTVPAEQIAWQLDLDPSAGDPAISVRQSAIPNEYVNTAFSERTNSGFETVTLVPPTLTDGSFYVTVYGTPPFRATLTNSRPLITDVPYAFTVTNDLPGRRGWRFYRITDIDSQLDSLGWELFLSEQPPGTEVALRHNAVPGRWWSRSNYLQGTVSKVSSNLDLTSLRGFLQAPRHPADIWYIGVSHTNQPLGAFVLTSRESSRPEISLTPQFTTNRVTDRPAGMLTYFKVVVPTNALGLELRLANVTGGTPQLVVCRDLLPVDLRSILANSNAWTSPNTSTTWPSGAQLYCQTDWTGFTTDALGTNEAGRFFFAGKGNPLEPGNYYIGVIDATSSTNESTFELLARGLFPEASFAELASDGSLVRTGIAAHEVVWARVTVPTNAPSWRLRLGMEKGDGSIALRQGGLPNYGAGVNSPTNLTGCQLQKIGNEHFVLLPASPATNVPAGIYYLAVVGEGQDPTSTRAGSNTCSFTLTSAGPLTVANLGTVDPLGTTNLVLAQTQEGGETRAFQFTVVSDTPVIEVRLRDRTGSPGMVLRPDSRLSEPPDTANYGFSGGWAPTWANDSLIRIPSPAAGAYTLLVQAAGSAGKYTNATYTLEVSAQQPRTLAFDGGSFTITNQPLDGWSYFRVVVPPEAMGWDVRLTNVVSGSPRLAICRDLVPYNLSTRTASGTTWTPYTATNWPSGWQVAPDKDWTGYTSSAAGTNEIGRVFAAGLGNPVEPGVYIVGVSNAAPGTATNLMRYTLISRGIGTNCSIPIMPLAFSGGEGAATAIPPREALYYQVEVPSNAPSWQLRLAATAGDALLLVRKDGLPNFGAAVSTAVTNVAGCELQKLGDEHFVLLATQTSNTVPAGTYYLAVVSEGVSPLSTTSRIGSNTCDYVIRSVGTLPVTDLGNIATHSSFSTNIVQPGGSVMAFQIHAVPGTPAVVLRLDNRVNNPGLTVRAGEVLPLTLETYGRQGGWSSDWSSSNYVRFPGQAGGTYTFLVHAANVAGKYPDASYTLRIYTLAYGTTPLAFDGGQETVVGHPSLEWTYFSVDVPTNAVGWDLRLRNPTGNPRLVICRSDWPWDLTSRLTNGTTWNWGSATNWPYAAQAAPGLDWTGYRYDADSSSTTGTVFAVGMGNPLEPGRYYIGVSSAPGSASSMSYTIASRGIGPDFTIPVTPLAPGTATANVTNLPAREAAYFSLQITNSEPLWKLRLLPVGGEALLAVRQGALPNVTAATNIAGCGVGGGHKFQKDQVENALFGRALGEPALLPGTYYVAAIGEGQAPQAGSGTLGAGTSDVTLESTLPAALVELGVAGGSTDLLRTNALESGATAAYAFTLPEGSSVLTVSLENVSGSPLLRVRNDDKIPLDPSAYGQDGGYRGVWESTNRVALNNPTSGVYTVTVLANGRASNWSSLQYTLRVHAEGTPVLTFDNGSAVVSNQVDLWQPYVVVVPTNAVGWDLRLVNVSQGAPRLVICRDQRPTSMAGHKELYGMTNWPTGWQLVPETDWTGLNGADGTSSTGRVFQVGMGNPLEPGLYYVSVTNVSRASPASYTILSRGIGPSYTVPVRDLDFSGGIATGLVVAREAAWYRLSVPSNTPNWKAVLAIEAGESLLVAQRSWLPNIGAHPTNSVNLTRGGKKMQKDGTEHLLALALGGVSSTNLPPGIYYLGVVSEGTSPSPLTGRIGTGTSQFTLFSHGSVTPVDLGGAGALDLTSQTTLRGGECELYRFSVPYGIPAIEASLEGVSGSPVMTLTGGSWPPAAALPYGADGGAAARFQSSNIITIPNPGPTNFALTVQAAGFAPLYPDVAYTLRVRSLPMKAISFDPRLNAGAVSNIAAGVLQDQQRTYCRVEVPATLAGKPVIGWKLSLSSTYGTAYMRVRKDALPEDGAPGTSAYFLRQAVFVPDYLSPGTWFVEIEAVGLTAFQARSENLELARPEWSMPAVGQVVTTPGLPAARPVFGDTGVDTNGITLTGDQGTDLEQDSFDYYAIVVPPGNGGLLRTELDAISGDANLYLRTNAPPTLSHNGIGSSGPLYTRALTNALGTSYANWAVLNGKAEAWLTPGTWYLCVHAAWGSSVRYRLILSTGQITDLAFAGGALAGESLAAGDWRYYRVAVPLDAPYNWTLNLTKQQGNVALYLRDTVPPGQGLFTLDYIDWGRDAKNHGPYSQFTGAGAWTLSVPPVRPGNTYYLGVRAINDAVYSISSIPGDVLLALNDLLPFRGTNITGQLPPGAIFRYRVDVPTDARRWSHSSSNASGVRWYLDQGTLPTMTTADHWYSTGATSTNNKALYNNSWPWLPGYSYYVAVTNTSAVVQPFSLRLDGRNCDNDDYDADGLPDCWELTYFADLPTFGPDSDPDGDGLSNLQELLAGTSPVHPDPGFVLLLNPASTASGDFEFSVIAALGRIYQVQSSTNLMPGTWKNVTDFFQGETSHPVHLHPPADESKLFYRVIYP